MATTVPTQDSPESKAESPAPAAYPPCNTVCRSLTKKLDTLSFILSECSGLADLLDSYAYHHKDEGKGPERAAFLPAFSVFKNVLSNASEALDPSAVQRELMRQGAIPNEYGSHLPQFNDPFTEIPTWNGPERLSDRLAACHVQARLIATILRDSESPEADREETAAACASLLADTLRQLSEDCARHEGREVSHA